MSSKKSVVFGILVLAAIVVSVLLDMDLISAAHAQVSGGGSGGDPFAKVNTKGGELAGWLRGKIAVSITTVVIIVVGLLMLMSRISHLVGVRIILGALLVGGAAGIAEWAYQ
ncbi:TrbC/VirB2 family protein [Nitrosovibrio sp. Nv6]|uniref:TrbC/VirB2 family protein n=1 Tax=Nitrosovibrio sp. Nv6 TaxID=1855340 RepID=UPI0008CFAA6E|nr:TrbC/VirB2 family protein [Nitrosovibrio sp. Nv6]SEP43273.1 TrbC/VIRB2 family protein [Nitrosovibrio sp. Nv6]